MTCWYKKGCNLVAENCEKICHRYLEMKYLIDNCGMPEADKFIKPLQPSREDYPVFIELQKLKDNILDFVLEGKNLYIVSENFGNGKTTWSLKLLYKYFDEIWNGNGFRIRGYFLYVPEFLNKLKVMDYRNSQEYKHLTKVLSTADLIVWDDIGANVLTAADHTNLSAFIDPRMLKGKANIFTGNLLDEDLKKAVGNRLHSRIWEASIIKKFTGIGRRSA